MTIRELAEVMRKVVESNCALNSDNSKPDIPTRRMRDFSSKRNFDIDRKKLRRRPSFGMPIFYRLKDYKMAKV